MSRRSPVSISWHRFQKQKSQDVHNTPRTKHTTISILRTNGTSYDIGGVCSPSFLPRAPFKVGAKSPGRRARRGDALGQMAGPLISSRSSPFQCIVECRRQSRFSSSKEQGTITQDQSAGALYRFVGGGVRRPTPQTTTSAVCVLVLVWTARRVRHVHAKQEKQLSLGAYRPQPRWRPVASALAFSTFGLCRRRTACSSRHSVVVGCVRIHQEAMDKIRCSCCLQAQGASGSPFPLPPTSQHISPSPR